MAHDRFAHDHYLIRTKIFKLFGAAFHVYDSAGNVLMYSKLKAFKLKEDIRLYTDETMTTEILSIQARQILDFSAAYDVIDPQARQKIGAIKRKGLKSILRDEWVFMDAGDREIGILQEDSTGMALLRRFIEAAAFFFPQKFHAEVNGQHACDYTQNFNPFVRKISVDFSGSALDRRLGVAAGVLLAAIEGKQS